MEAKEYTKKLSSLRSNFSFTSLQPEGEVSNIVYNTSLLYVAFKNKMALSD